MLWLSVPLFATIAAAAILMREFRDGRGSPELKATLHAMAIGVALELILLVVRIHT